MTLSEKSKGPKIKWYLRPVPVIIAILCAGPFALPLLWISPSFKKIHKVAITALVIIFTVWLVKCSVDLYNILLNELKELDKIMNQ